MSKRAEGARHQPPSSYTLRKEYGELVGTPEARKVAAATMDLNEYLWQRKQEGLLDRNFQSTPGKIAYHLPCHLKAQNIGFKSRDVLRAVGAEVTMVDKCCGVDGTWGLKKQYFEESFKIAEPALTAFKNAQPATVVTDCPLAAIQFDQHSDSGPFIPSRCSRELRPGRFPTPVEKQGRIMPP
jgi:Fe-S oxidoreductase